MVRENRALDPDLHFVFPCLESKHTQAKAFYA